MSTPASVRIAERNLALFRHVWKANLVTSLLQPMLYLLAMGVGVGALVNRNDSSTRLLEGLPYIAFVAPGLLATTAMMVASFESLWPVYDGVAWSHHYDAISATPLEPRDIATAHALWMLFRTGAAAAMVALAMALFPDVRSWGLILAVPAAMLGGVAFGMPFAAWAITRKQEISFPVIQRFVIVPLFLFGGAFFPVSQLPAVARYLGYATPLWHCVELCRSLVSGTSMSVVAGLGHAGYLIGWGLVGGVVMTRAARTRLFA